MDSLGSVHVVRAIICCDGRVLAARREVGGQVRWGFPGGVVEAGETPEQACRRKLLDDQGLALQTLWFLDTVEQDLPSPKLSIDVLVAPLSGLRERMPDDGSRRWLGREDLLDPIWHEADVRIVRMLGTFWDAIFEAEHL